MDTSRAGELADRVFQGMIGFLEIGGIYLGDKLGLYRSLHEDGPASSAGLAQRLNMDERYLREWLEHQAVSSYLDVDDVALPAQERVYSLPEEFAALLVEQEHPSYLAPVGRAMLGSVRPIDQLVEAYRTGAGVPYEDYGPDMACGIAAFNRPIFMNSIGQEWFPAMPDVHAALQQPGARVADIGMGMAWSSIAIAKAYPNVTVDGYDLDELSVNGARENIRGAGLSDRVNAEVRNAGDPGLSGQYDLACAFECLHDMSNPVAALSAMRQLVGDRGAVLVVDEKVQPEFTVPGDDVERLMYGFSILHCLPVGRVDTPSVATGTVMRQSTMERYALEAGFAEIEVLPIENDLYRFYRLRG